MSTNENEQISKSHDAVGKSYLFPRPSIQFCKIVYDNGSDLKRKTNEEYFNLTLLLLEH